MEEIKVELKKIGTCPVCGIGQVVTGSNGYMCNHFKSLEDQCQFAIYKSYFGKEITEELATKLINDGETEIFTDLIKKDGSCFSASLKIEDGFVKPHFANKIMDFQCPVCESDVEELAGGYACVNYKNNREDEDDERDCNFFIPKTVAQYTLTNKDVKNLIEKGETDFIEDKFLNKQSETFSARLVRSEDGTLKFSNILCKCPKCKTGDIYSAPKGYNCSNYKDENIKCNFVVWKQIAGRDISAKEAVTLCENKVTPLLSGFRSKEKGEFSKMLSLNEEYKVVMI